MADAVFQAFFFRMTDLIRGTKMHAEKNLSRSRKILGILKHECIHCIHNSLDESKVFQTHNSVLLGPLYGMAKQSR